MPTKTVAPSPRPWTYDPADGVIADCHGIATLCLGRAGLDGLLPDKADIDYVVRSVNSHDALLSALRDLLAWVDTEQTNSQILRAARESARAAIAEADGK